jgi:hypothetical protein
MELPITLITQDVTMIDTTKWIAELEEVERMSRDELLVEVKKYR